MDIDLLSIIIGLVVGLIIGYFVDLWYFRNKRICTEAERKLKTSYERLQVENKELITRTDSLDGELRVSNTRFTDLSTKHKSEVSDWRTKYSSLEATASAPSDVEIRLKNENAQLRSDLDGVNAKLAAVPTGPSKLELSLKDENARLRADLDGVNTKLSAVPTGPSKLELSLKEENALLQAELDGVNAKFAAIPTGPSDLEVSLKEENARLRADLDGLNAKLAAVPTGPSDLELSLKDENARLQADLDGLNTKFAAIPTGPSDLELNLQNENKGLLGLIDELKGKLSAKDTEINKLSAAAPVVGAAGLAATAASSYDYSADPDDLTKIWGIGPKINGVLNRVGIYKFSQLAATNAERLNEIMDTAGERFNLANNDTWQEQAALARDGKWVDLEKLQAKLAEERSSSS